jgi:hypothetical protein
MMGFKLKSEDTNAKQSNFDSIRHDQSNNNYNDTYIANQTININIYLTGQGQPHLKQVLQGDDDPSLPFNPF